MKRRAIAGEHGLTLDRTAQPGAGGITRPPAPWGASPGRRCSAGGRATAEEEVRRA